MISREELLQLAQVESKEGCAVSFYFQPHTPQDQSHREEAIIVKDLVREALRKSERNGNHDSLRDDLNQILQSAEALHGNHSRGKVILACREKGIWRELDVPARMGRSELTVNSRFHLKPLVVAQSGPPRACIALVDRKKARMFELLGQHLLEMPTIEFGQVPKHGRSDGYMGYDAGHRERHVENEVMHHLKWFAESLQSLLTRDKYRALLVGCREDLWPELEPHLHTYVKQRLVGRFLLDPVAATADEVREYAQRILEKNHKTEQQWLLHEVIGEAQRNARGAVGLRHVLTALERQEVQTLLVSRGFTAEAVECTNCKHLDTRMVHQCAVCGQATHQLSDVSDALVGIALRNGADIRFVDSDPELEKAGHVAALLRFRGDQKTTGKVAV
jgi:peptide chain release factor subunit 1